MQRDGFIIDRVFVPMDIVECFRSHRLGKMDEEEFEEAVSESSIEFEVQCHMVFNFMLDSKTLINALYQNELCDRLDNEEDDDSEAMLDGLINKLIDRIAYLKNSSY
jgi:hypothetical protein